MGEVSLLIVALVIVALLAVLLGALVVRDLGAWRTVTGRRVVLNLKTGRAVDGLLVRRTGDLLFLRQAVALEPGAEPAPVDGEVVVLRGEIDFIQVT